MTTPTPLALADALDEMSTVLDMGRKPDYRCSRRQAAALLRTQHAAIERKDALLRRAAVHLSRIAMAAGAPTPPGVNVGWIAHYAEQAEKELRKELSQ